MLRVTKRLSGEAGQTRMYRRIRTNILKFLLPLLSSKEEKRRRADRT